MSPGRRAWAAWPLTRDALPPARPAGTIGILLCLAALAGGFVHFTALADDARDLASAREIQARLDAGATWIPLTEIWPLPWTFACVEPPPLAASFYDAAADDRTANRLVFVDQHADVTSVLRLSRRLVGTLAPDIDGPACLSRDTAPALEAEPRPHRDGARRLVLVSGM